MQLRFTASTCKKFGQSGSDKLASLGFSHEDQHRLPISMPRY